MENIPSLPPRTASPVNVEAMIEEDNSSRHSTRRPEAMPINETQRSKI